MDAWKTYRLEDFIPFGPEVYWRLLERINEAFWPLHLLTVTLGIAAVLLALRGNPRIALLLLAPAWLSSSIIFHLNYYAELNWAAPWFGWAFVIEAAFLLATVAFIGRDTSRDHASQVTTWIGATIAIFALLAYPLIAATLGAGPTHAETYGLHPDPTVITTLGVLLVAQRGISTWLTVPIPFLWCLITTLTLVLLEATWAWLPLAVAVIAATLLAIANISAKRSTADRPPSNKAPSS